MNGWRPPTWNIDWEAVGSKLRDAGISGWLKFAVKQKTYPASHQTPDPLGTSQSGYGDERIPYQPVLHQPGYLPTPVPQRYVTLSQLRAFQESMANVPAFQRSVVTIGGQQYAPSGWTLANPELAQFGGERRYNYQNLTPAGIPVGQYGPLYDPRYGSIAHG